MYSKKKLLIEFIKKVELNQPASDFTENVLSFIINEALIENKEDVTLKNILQKNVIISPSEGFTDIVVSMTKERKSKTSFRPLISKNTLITIITSIIILALFFEFNRDEAATALGSSFFYLKILNIIQQTPPLLSMSIMSISLLLLLDSILFKKN
jgi:predicted transcriptional regulator